MGKIGLWEFFFYPRVLGIEEERYKCKRKI